MASKRVAIEIVKIESNGDVQEPEMNIEDILIQDFVNYAIRLRDYASEVPLRGAIFRNLILFGANMFPHRREEILDLINGQKSEKPIPVNPKIQQSVESNQARQVTGKEVLIVGGVVTGVGAGEHCDSCPQ